MIYFITDRRPGETPIPPAVLHHALHAGRIHPRLNFEISATSRPWVW